MQNSAGAGAEPKGNRVSSTATWSLDLWYWLSCHILSRNHIAIHLVAIEAVVWRRQYAFFHVILVTLDLMSWVIQTQMMNELEEMWYGIAEGHPREFFLTHSLVD